MIAILGWIVSGGCALALFAAIAAAPLALLVFAIDAAVGRRIAARYRSLLWTLVAVRLLMPLAPECPLSLQNVWRLVVSHGEPQGAHRMDSILPVGRTLPTPAAFATNDAAIPGEWFANPGADAPGAAFDWQSTIVCGLSTLWFVGVAIIMVRAAIASARFARRLRPLPCIEDRAIIDLLLHVCDQVGVGRRPRVKYVPDLPAPALFGVLRPTLCLPEGARFQLSENQLRMIIVHEVTHIRRRDGYLSWLLTVVQAVHWFNPVAWLATGRIAMYREQACDDAVRRLAAPAERRVYADLLLRFASGRPAANLGLIGMWFARPAGQLTARVKAFSIADESRRTVPRLAIVALLGILMAVGLTDAATSNSKAPEVQTISEFMNRGAPAARLFETLTPNDSRDMEDDLIEERCYSIAAAMAKLAQANPSADARQWVLSYLKQPSLNPRSVRQDESDPNQLRVTMTRRDHAIFADLLDAVSRSGPWQVAIESRVLRAPHIEAIGEVNWEDAVKFALPTVKTSPPWPERGGSEETSTKEGLAVSAESVSWEYAPYLAVVVDREKMHKIVNRLQSGSQSSLLSCPKVTVFNGQRAVVLDEGQCPFVVGVHYIKGALATAAQPGIAVLSEGTRLDVQPRVIDAKALDLRCQITVSRIDDVSEIKLPGQEVVVQNPHGSRQTITARCRLTPGDALLIAPIAAKRKDDESGCLLYTVAAEWFPTPDEFAKNVSASSDKPQ